MKDYKKYINKREVGLIEKASINIVRIHYFLMLF